ncbi:pilus assembly protein [Rhizobium sp. P38BS-XIX]|uniref:TadE/TadG family type IV pilus assembly protein n=1 Tax=Rhizobium sp. P38BS-XIX TaxID=2726740 RepID=UPI00145652E2|nr:TadE/TadG family type IV pilus assembly protein [Rhizobium sp. P38BS-XIX]NLR98549.1 pilus assembly protein [Rhizobium sp. P38BS-XIX]
MIQDNDILDSKSAERQPVRKRLLGFVRSQDGSAAIEFALLAIPYFLIVFAIIETFVAFTAEQVVSNAVDTLSRQIRTGQITALNTSQQQFRQAFCNEISVLITCSSTEVATPANLYLDVETYLSFASMPTTVPRKSTTDPYSDLNTTGFAFAPGGAKTLNMVRAYYRWQVITDLMRPYLTNVRPSDGSASVYLIVATAAFQNENYP